MTVYFTHLRTIAVTLCIIFMFTEATSTPITVTVISATGFSNDSNQTESTSNTNTTNGTPPSRKTHSVMFLVLIAYAGKQL